MDDRCSLIIHTVESLLNEFSGLLMNKCQQTGLGERELGRLGFSVDGESMGSRLVSTNADTAHTHGIVDVLYVSSYLIIGFL